MQLIEQLTVFVVFLSFVAAVSGFCFGYDTGVISASLVSIKDDFGHILSNVEKEWISSATSIGALLGSVIDSDIQGGYWLITQSFIIGSFGRQDWSKMGFGIRRCLVHRWSYHHLLVVLGGADDRWPIYPGSWYVRIAPTRPALICRCRYGCCHCTCLYW